MPLSPSITHSWTIRSVLVAARRSDGTASLAAGQPNGLRAFPRKPARVRATPPRPPPPGQRRPQRRQGRYGPSSARGRYGAVWAANQADLLLPSRTTNWQPIPVGGHAAGRGAARQGIVKSGHPRWGWPSANVGTHARPDGEGRQAPPPVPNHSVLETPGRPLKPSRRKTAHSEPVLLPVS